MRTLQGQISGMRTAPQKASIARPASWKLTNLRGAGGANLTVESSSLFIAQVLKSLGNGLWSLKSTCSTTKLSYLSAYLKGQIKF